MSARSPLALFGAAALLTLTACIEEVDTLPGDVEPATVPTIPTTESIAADDGDSTDDPPAPPGTDAPDLVMAAAFDPAAAWSNVELPSVQPGTDLLPDATPRESQGWTILYYGMADTDLEPYLIEDVNEIGTVSEGPGVQFFSLIDRSADYGEDAALDLGAWEGGWLVDIRGGAGDVLADLGDVDTGDPQVLADFIATGILNFPAQQYALVISDHGASWPGMGPDEGSFGDGVLDLPDLYAGIRAGLAGAGIDQLDLLGFDACLMATYEVASTLTPVARRLLASQELEPGHGWDYGVFEALHGQPDMSVDELGALIIDGFAAQATEWGTDTDITLSLVDLERVGVLDEAVAEFAAAMSGRAAAVGPAVGRVRAATLSFGRSPDPDMDTHMADLGMLVAGIGVEALDLSDQADAVLRAINDVVVYKVEGQATRGATGLAVYFPPRIEHFSQSYTYLPGSYWWTQFLESFYDAGQAIPEEHQPTFTNVEGQAEVGFDDYGLWISGEFDAAAADNVSEAWIEYGVVDDEDGTITYIGRESADISDDGSGLVTGSYDLTALQLTDGVDSAYAFLELVWGTESDIATVDIPLIYVAPGESLDDGRDVLLEMTYDATEGDVISETYYSYNAAAGTFGELTADPEGLLFPQLYVESGDTGEWALSSDVGLWADLPNLLYEFPELESGTQLFVRLLVSDFGGNTASVSALAEIP